MVVDTSAVIAVLRLEAEARIFAEAIAAAARRLMSTGTLLELGIIAEARWGEEGAESVDEFVTAAGIMVVPFDDDQVAVARAAWRRYGRGRHRAGLNFGDCFAYALAKKSGEPLLFKGKDFNHTDIEIWRNP